MIKNDIYLYGSLTLATSYPSAKLARVGDEGFSIGKVANDCGIGPQITYKI